MRGQQGGVKQSTAQRRQHYDCTVEYDNLRGTLRPQYGTQ